MGFYIGTYASAEEDGILEVKYDRETDSLQVTGRQRGVTNPSWLLLHPNGRVLYAVEERNPDGGLCAFLIDEALGGKETFPVAGNDAATQEQQERQGTPFLHPCGSWPTGGADPCHLSLDDRGEFLFVSNYTSGSLAVFRLGENGVPAERTDLVQHTGHSTGPGADPVRQEGPHVHFSAFHEGELYVVDLGQDTVFRYELDRESGRLRDTGRPIVLPAGRGPRHLAFGPDNRLYVLCELSSSLFVLEKQEDGAYQAVQEISALSQGVTDKVNTAAAIHFSEDGRMLYTSNRGEDSIAAFALEEDGRVRRIGFAASGGRVPRDFAVCGDRLLAANQESNELTVLVNLENDIKNMNHQDPAGEKQRSTVNHEKWSGIDQEEKGEGVLFALPTQGRPVCLTPVPEPHELPEPHPEEESNKAPEPCTGDDLRSDELSLD
ncbi:MAG: lactonase family protein, partial [Eubacteriales bacterium]|nr:lactonase family protein [Eubacteriales bacterium]